MRKVILIAATISCFFSASAQQKITDTVAPAYSADTQPSTADKVFTSVEQMPEFPGGMPALMKYLSTNIHYPEAAKKESIQGRVIVQFVVTEAGKITHAAIRRDIGGGCGEEALRVVNHMPNWKPGKQNGVAVKVYYTLPVTFRFEEPAPEVATPAK